MEIRVHGPGRSRRRSRSRCARPGNDFELAAGLCLTEGLLAGADDIDTIAYCLGRRRASSCTTS